MTKIYQITLCSLAALCILALANGKQVIAQDKPNIVVIWGDDIGVSNISAYHRGMMGGSTPNIDRIAKEGIMFTDYYAQHEEGLESHLPAGGQSLIGLVTPVGKGILGDSPIFYTMGGFFIPLNESDIYISGVFGPVRISKKGK